MFPRSVCNYYDGNDDDNGDDDVGVVADSDYNYDDDYEAEQMVKITCVICDQLHYVAEGFYVRVRVNVAHPLVDDSDLVMLNLHLIYFTLAPKRKSVGTYF